MKEGRDDMASMRQKIGVIGVGAVGAAALVVAALGTVGGVGFFSQPANTRKASVATPKLKQDDMFMQ